MQCRAALFLLACIPFFTACAIIPIKRPLQPAVSKPSSPPVTLRRAQFLMGTLVELTAVAPGDVIAQAALTAGFQEIRRLENMLSTWIETSELSRINQAAGLEPIGVSAETYDLLRRALEGAEYTEGWLNIAIGPAVRLGNIPEAARMPSAMRLLVT